MAHDRNEVQMNKWMNANKYSRNIPNFSEREWLEQGMRGDNYISELIT